MSILSIAATGMSAQQTNVENIANNIANLNTTGFKRSRVEFKDLMYQNIQAPGVSTTDTNTPAPTGISLGTGVATANIYRINEQGPITQTSNPLDLAINGNGFIQVQLPSGTTAYTRDGSLQVNAQGQIVDANGFQVLPSITIPTTSTGITINNSGQVFATIPGQTTPQNLGQIQLANFINPAGLQATGGNLYQETEASGTATVGNPGTEQFGTLTQGSLENSNVDIVTEMTNMISAQRAYEMNSKAIKTADDMMQVVSNLK